MIADAFRAEEVGPTPDGRRLRIEWGDGHVSTYESRHLRMRCPCAGCMDETTGERILTEEMVPAGVHPTEIRYVGRYALQFFWSDGHSTGIYPFEYLRRLCRCGECDGVGDPGGGER